MPEYLRHFLAVAIFILLAAVPVSFIYSPFKAWQAYKNLKNISSAFPGAKLSYCIFEAKLTGTYQGMPFVLRHYVGNVGYYAKPNYDPGIAVSLKFANKAKMRIVIYKFGDAMSSCAKTAVFLKNVEDLPAGIEKFNLYSNMPFEARHFFKDIKRIEALKYFWRNYWLTGMKSMSIGKRCIFVHKSVSEADLTPGLIREILDNMIALKISNVESA